MKIEVTASSNQLRRDGRMPSSCRVVERCPTILCLKIDVTARCQELLRDGLMPFIGRFVEWRVPNLVLVVDEGLRTLCRQERSNLRCITITRSLPKLLDK